MIVRIGGGGGGDAKWVTVAVQVALPSLDLRKTKIITVSGIMVILHGTWLGVLQDAMIVRQSEKEEEYI